MQGLGYKEIYSYLEGECSLEEAIEQIKCSTRHFAKRQLTWFKSHTLILLNVLLLLLIHLLSSDLLFD